MGEDGGNGPRLGSQLRRVNLGMCKILSPTNVSWNQSSAPEYRLEFMHSTQSHVSTEWQASSKSTPALGFLDLPRELRDMLYREICDHLSNREGHDWRASEQDALQTFKPPHRRGSKGTCDSSLDEDLGKGLQDCAIMRTCRQIHSEFAEMLYSKPIQIWLMRYINVYPLATTYTHLIQSVLVLIPFQGTAPLKPWCDAVRVSNQLAKHFPRLKNLRIGWHDPELKHISAQIGSVWEIFEGTAPGSRESHVKSVLKVLRSGCRELGMSATVPHTFELVQLRKGVNINTPFTEAALILRRKPPKPKETRG